MKITNIHLMEEGLPISEYRRIAESYDPYNIECYKDGSVYIVIPSEDKYIFNVDRICFSESVVFEDITKHVKVVKSTKLAKALYKGKVLGEFNGMLAVEL